MLVNFIKLFEIPDFNESYLDGEKVEVIYAYYAFVNCVATEVKRINPKKDSS